MDIWDISLNSRRDLFESNLESTNVSNCSWFKSRHRDNGWTRHLVCVRGLVFAGFTPAVCDPARRRGRDTGSVLHVWTLRAERDGDALRPRSLQLYQKPDLCSSSCALVRVRRLSPHCTTALLLTKTALNMLKYYYNSFLCEYVLKCNLFLWLNLYFQHHYCSLQCHMIFRNHNNMKHFWLLSMLKTVIFLWKLMRFIFQGFTDEYKVENSRIYLKYKYFAT